MDFHETACQIPAVASGRPASEGRLRHLHAKLDEFFLSRTDGHFPRGGRTCKESWRQSEGSPALMEIFVDRQTVWQADGKARPCAAAQNQMVIDPQLGQSPTSNSRQQVPRGIKDSNAQNSAQLYYEPFKLQSSKRK